MGVSVIKSDYDSSLIYAGSHPFVLVQTMNINWTDY